MGAAALAVTVAVGMAVVLLIRGALGGGGDDDAVDPPAVVAPSSPDARFAERLAAAQTTDELWELGEILFDWTGTRSADRASVTAAELRGWLVEDWEYHAWGDQLGAEVLRDLRRLDKR